MAARTQTLLFVGAVAAVGLLVRGSNGLPADGQIPFLPHSRVPRPEDIAAALEPDLFHDLEAHVQSLPDSRLLRWPDGHEEWVTEGEKALVIYAERGRRFVDITEMVPPRDALAIDDDFPTSVRHGNATLSPLFNKISTSRMQKRLAKLSSFRTRYYRSQTGRDSQLWLFELIKDIAASSPTSNVTITEFPHSWGQSSIIARFHSPDHDHQAAVIAGAHLDSTNLLPFLPAPGADDDGSGTITILEAFTVLIENGWKPMHRPVEFHWYSAEEGGMLGSSEVTRAYQATGTLVKSFVQTDMCAFVKKGTKPRVGIVTDFVNPKLSAFMRMLVDEYLAIVWVDTKCGYACSDHASWTTIGVPSAFGIEGLFSDSNPHIHSGTDRLDVSNEFSFEHMLQFCRLSLSYIAEMAGGKEDWLV